MRKSQRTIDLVFCALFAIFAFATIAEAQIPPPSYGFLELVDYKNEPVVDASVRSLSGYGFSQMPSVQGRLLDKTNRYGLLEGGVEIGYSNREAPFSIDKSGFYTFINYFGLFDFLNNGRRNNKDEPLKIELLIIPKTNAEKKAIGNEQVKREFFGAARRGDTAAVRTYIKSGLSPNLTTSDLRGIPAAKDVPIIIYAARSGNGETVREFLSSGVSVRKKNGSTLNVLTVYLDAYPYRQSYPATEADEKEALNVYENGAEYLVEAGAEVDLEALMLAVDRGYTRTVKKLISRGELINKQDNIGRTALGVAVERGRTEIVDFLLKKGANPNLLSGRPDEQNSYYCGTPLMHAVWRADVDLVTLLLANKADPNLTCKNGQNALRIAMISRKYEIFDALVKAGADVKAVDENGQTNLIVAAKDGDAAAVKKMIEMGVPVNARDKEGVTALMIAIKLGARNGSRFEKVKLLLEAGADPNVASEEMYENGNRFVRCETALISAAQSTDHYGAENEIVDLLIAGKADVNFTCRNGENALLGAISNGQTIGVKKLLAAGADVKGEKGGTALAQAKKLLQFEYIKRQMEEIIKLLEAAGAGSSR